MRLSLAGGLPAPVPFLAPLGAPSATRWYCVRSKPNVETRVVFLLRSMGFDVWLPQVLKKRGWPRPSARLVPWLPCYLFVAFDVADDAWRLIPTRSGVARLFSSDPERPTPLPVGAVELLMEHPELTAPEEGAALAPVPVGARARLLSGPLAGFEYLCAWSDERKVLLMSALLGGVRLEVAREAVEVVG